jgi:sec-independent protein translocase protein TatC
MRILTFPFRSLSRWLAGLPSRIQYLLTYEPEDAPLGDAIARSVNDFEGVLEHVDELRSRLIWSVLVVALGTGLSFTFMPQILDFLTTPLPGGLDQMQAIDVTEPVGTVMRIALLSGFTLSIPFLALQVWLFIAPGISRRARFTGCLAIPAATLFFVGGLAFAYFVMLPTALPFLLNFMGINTLPRPASYLGFATSLMFWIGLFFEFPLVIFLLAGIGLVRAETLLKQGRLAIVIIAVLSAIITPTVDPVSMSLVMVPMLLLYVLSIGLAYLAQGRRERRARAAG